jgi:sec-independent protein translocase protein TatC
MPEPREDDLFRESTMTFGEHLGELRNCLLKAIYGLIGGFIVGLMVGGHVVAFIQQPLLLALTRYYQDESKHRVELQLEKLKQADQQRPWTEKQVEEFRKQANDYVEGRNLFVDEVYVDPAQALKALQDAYPEQLGNVPPLPQTQSPDGKELGRLIHLFLWHRSEDDSRLRSKGLGVTEAFAVYVKVSLLVGVLLASPWIFYQIWHFVAAGLYPHERRYVHKYVPFSVGLFLLGAGLAFFVVFRPVLAFLLTFNRSQVIDPELRINEWLRFVLILPVGFGIGFQLPLVMLFLERIGVFTVKSYLSQWRIAVLVIFVIAGILMPPDPYSMILMAFSLTFLFFGGVLLCKLLPRKSSPFGEAK